MANLNWCMHDRLRACKVVAIAKLCKVVQSCAKLCKACVASDGACGICFMHVTFMVASLQTGYELSRQS
eukprot:843649-Pleurochrysis_carterae.AAC.1